MREFTYDRFAPNTHTEFTRRIPSLPKKQMARDARIAKAIVVAYDLHNDIGRVKELFFKNAKLLSNPRYWELMRTVWVVTGSTDNAHEFIPYMKSNRPCKGWFMTPEDAEALDKMQFPLTVWRAYDNEPDPGISWSINKEWVENYAKVKGRKVKSRQVERKQIFAYISRRLESEIIILPDEGEPPKALMFRGVLIC